METQEQVIGVLFIAQSYVKLSASGYDALNTVRNEYSVEEGRNLSCSTPT